MLILRFEIKRLHVRTLWVVQKRKVDCIKLFIQYLELNIQNREVRNDLVISRSDHLINTFYNSIYKNWIFFLFEISLLGIFLTRDQLG